MFLDLAQVVAGLVLLLAAGDILVRGAIAAGLKLNIPAIIIGLTIVAFGTSAPELFVTIQATMEGVPGIAVGNVIGSNIANVLLVLGVPALLAPIGDHSHETKRNYEIMLGVTLITVALCWFSPLTWWQGVLLLGMLAGFLYYNYSRAQMARAAVAAPTAPALAAIAVHPEGAAPLSPELAIQRAEEAEFKRNEALEAEGYGTDEIDMDDADLPVWKVVALIIGGLIGLPIGADFIVEGARGLAGAAGVSDETIGLTLVALGTSLPELATTVMAAVRGRADVAIGNVIGSNVFNLLCILGVAASMGSIEIPHDTFQLNMLVMIGAALALAPFVWLGMHLGKVTGGAFVAAYGLYISLAFATGANAQPPGGESAAAAPSPAVVAPSP